MMRFGSGCYNVKEVEVIKESDAARAHGRNIAARVVFLDGSQHDFELDRNAPGADLLDRVFLHLELAEKDYFGLRFAELVGDDEPRPMRWLDAGPPYTLYFGVKFYVSDPSKLAEEYTRYHFYLQVRKDLQDGTLPAPEPNAALLASFAAQSEFGDYNADEMPSTYLDNVEYVPQQSAGFLRKVAELHRMHAGQTPADAEYNFLDHARRLELYGVDAYDAKDSHGAAISVGACAAGVCAIRNGVKTNVFSWSRIMKISFKRKQFFIEVKMDENRPETSVGFTLCSTRLCKLLWKACIEHHTFFRLITPPAPQHKGLFSLGSRYRFR